MTSILSWDDLEEDNPLKKVESQHIALKAVQNLENLDLTSANLEFDQHQAVLNQRRDLQLTTMSGTDEELGDILKQRAVNNIKELTKHLDSGGRVLVDDKRLLNCHSDLNQLVPFKYNWSWSLYLTSTEHHWMPAECNLWDDEKVLKSLPLESNHAFGLWYRYSFIKHRLFNIGHLLNCYRLITNPECRQYLLRQGFETSLVSHVEMAISDIFDGHLGDIAPGGAVATMNQLVNIIGKVTTTLRDRTFSTQGTPNTQRFITELATASLIINTLIPTLLHESIRTSSIALPNVNRALYYMQRDIQTQMTWMELFISNVLDENPDIDKQQIRDEIIQTLRAVLPVIKTCLPQHSFLFLPLATRYLKNMGMSYPIEMSLDRQQVDAWDSLITYLNSMTPKVDFEAGLSGNGGALGW